jgi:hypothetical protein
LCVISCTQKHTKQDTTDLVKQWNDKQIVFPQNMVFTRYANDTVDYTIPESEYKILVYIDSFGCAGCTLQGAMWRDFIYYIDSATNKNVPFLFFFNPRNRNELTEILQYAELDIPVCVDINDELNKLNKFPDDIKFRTFLLNKHNQVLIVGNPIYSETIERLYIKQITGKESPPISPIKTEALTNQTEINLGELKINETKETVFQINNTGKRSLIIYTAKTSCNYITAEFDKLPIKPNDFTVLRVKVKPISIGHFAEKIMVNCNTKEPVVLQIKGEVK